MRIFHEPLSRRRFLGAAGAVVAGAVATSCAGLTGRRGTVRFFHNETDPRTVRFFNRAIAEYERDNPGVDIKMELVSTDGRLQRLLSMQAIRRLPGIFKLLPEERYTFAKKGILEPLDDVVDRIGRDDFVGGALIPIDDVNYDIPYTLNPFSHYWYRSDLFGARDLEPATTWRGLGRRAKRIQDSSEVYGTTVPASLGRMGDIFFAQILWSNGGTFFDGDFEVSLDRGDAAASALDVIEALAAAAPPGIRSYSYDDMVSTYVSGQVAQVVYDAGVVSTASVDAKKILANTESSGLLAGDTGVGVGYANPNLFGVSTKKYGNPDVAAAKDFLVYILSGQRALEFSLTDYPGLTPPLGSTQQEIRRVENMVNDKYSHLVDRAFDLRNTMDFTSEAGAEIVDGELRPSREVNPRSPSISNRYIGANLMQEVLVRRTPKDRAVRKWANELRKAVGE